MSDSRKITAAAARSRLAVGIGAALFAASSSATAPIAAGPFAGLSHLHQHGSSPAKHRTGMVPGRSTVALAASSVSVTSCDDDFGAGTLRQVMNLAEPGGTVDLSGLACSTITLQHGAIEIPWSDLTIVGPGSGRLSIDGAAADRVFKHTPKDSTLTLHGLRVANGMITGDNVYGGCIYAGGTLLLEDVVVTSCKAIGQQRAAGGGIVALTSLTAVGSTISDNVAQSVQGTDEDGVFAGGGGAYAGQNMALIRSVVTGNQTIAAKGMAFGGGVVGPVFHAKYSTISGNDASSAGTIYDPGLGGGIVSTSDAMIFACTVEGNSADFGGALFSNDDYYEAVTRITQTTVSGNVGRIGAGAIDVLGAISLENSTIAFNSSGAPLPFALFLQGAVTARSSIIANNVPADVAAAAIDGDHDIIKNAEASTVLPMDTKTSDPKLQPLASNGGPTRTHALGSGSPAIDAGVNPFTWQLDQRGPTYRRVVGAAADIGAYEVDSDHIFGTALEYPSG